MVLAELCVIAYGSVADVFANHTHTEQSLLVLIVDSNGYSIITITLLLTRIECIQCTFNLKAHFFNLFSHSYQQCLWHPHSHNKID